MGRFPTLDGLTVCAFALPFCWLAQYRKCAQSGIANAIRRWVHHSGHRRRDGRSQVHVTVKRTSRRLEPSRAEHPGAVRSACTPPAGIISRYAAAFRLCGFSSAVSYLTHGVFHARFYRTSDGIILRSAAPARSSNASAYIAPITTDHTTSAPSFQGGQYKRTDVRVDAKIQVHGRAKRRQ